MTNFFYYDQSFQKRGQYTEQELKELLAQGTISRETLIGEMGGEHTDAKLKRMGELFPDLFFKSASPQAAPETSPGFFDFGFTRFITNTWISFIWIVIVTLTILVFCVAILAGLFTLSQGGVSPAGVGIILLATIIAPLFLLFARMGLEGVIVLFRIETHLRSIREHYEKK